MLIGIGARRRLVVLLGCALAMVGGLLFAPLTPVAAAATYYVGSTADTATTTSCTSSTNTTCTLRGAISLATSGSDTITFTDAAFPANTPQTITLTTANGTLTLATSVTINGTGHSVIVDGNCTLTNGVCASGGVTVFTVAPGVTAALTALTIQHGNIISNTTGSGGGGGIANGGTLTVTNSTLSGNTASGNGGYGGGIFNSGTLTVTNSTFSGNAAVVGGGIFSFGTLTVTNSTFSGNIAKSGGTGGISAGGGIASGSGFGGGGGIFTITNSTFSGNTANVGGGIFNSGSLTMTNSTFFGNTASGNVGNGGGISQQGGMLTVTNSTLSGNTANGSGGGIAQQGGTVRLTNTIVAGNTAPPFGGGGPDLFGTFTSGGHNLIGITAGGSGITNGTNGDIVTNNSLLGTLGNNGGPTQTIPLFFGSPAIGAGDPAVCNQTGTGKVNGTDQRGVTRPTTLCAIGTFEPLLSAISLNSGSVAGGAPVTLTGAGFAAGATVFIGGVNCTDVQIGNNGTSLRCTTGAHAAGTVDVVLVGNATGVLYGGYTYGVIAPAPTPPRPTAAATGAANSMPGARPRVPTVAPTPLPAPTRR